MILKRSDLISKFTAWKPVELPCPEWSGSVLIRRMLADELVEFSETMRNLDGVEANKALIMAFVVDEDNHPIFTSEDAEWLGRQPASVVNRIARKVVEVNALSKEDDDKAVENFGKAGS